MSFELTIAGRTGYVGHHLLQALGVPELCQLISGLEAVMMGGSLVAQVSLPLGRPVLGVHQ
jgi:hypothetical protein